MTDPKNTGFPVFGSSFSGNSFSSLSKSTGLFDEELKKDDSTSLDSDTVKLTPRSSIEVKTGEEDEKTLHQVTRSSYLDPRKAVQI